MIRLLIYLGLYLNLVISFLLKKSTMSWVGFLFGLEGHIKPNPFKQIQNYWVGRAHVVLFSSIVDLSIWMVWIDPNTCCLILRTSHSISFTSLLCWEGIIHISTYFLFYGSDKGMSPTWELSPDQVKGLLNFSWKSPHPRDIGLLTWHPPSVSQLLIFIYKTGKTSLE